MSYYESNDEAAFGRSYAIVIAMIVLAVALTGCSLTTGGTMAAIQNADEALAAKYGVPASVVQGARKVLGIPDARTLPGPDRVLPEGWTWRYDLLGPDGKVVNQADYHWDTTPRLVKAGEGVAASVFTSTPTSDTATLEGLLKLIQSNPALLAPAK